MMPPFRYFARRRLLKKLSRKERHNLVSFSNLGSVVLYLDRNCPDWAACEREALAYFSKFGIKMNTVVLTDFNKDSIGRRVKNPGEPKDLGNEDMLLSLVPHCSFTMSYEALRSNSKFKVGIADPRAQKLYDLVVRAPEYPALTPLEMFGRVTSVLEKIM